MLVQFVCFFWCFLGGPLRFCPKWTWGIQVRVQLEHPTPASKPTTSTTTRPLGLGDLLCNFTQFCLLRRQHFSSDERHAVDFCCRRWRCCPKFRQTNLVDENHPETVKLEASSHGLQQLENKSPLPPLPNHKKVTFRNCLGGFAFFIFGWQNLKNPWNPETRFQLGRVGELLLLCLGAGSFRRHIERLSTWKLLFSLCFSHDFSNLAHASASPPSSSLVAHLLQAKSFLVTDQVQLVATAVDDALSVLYYCPHVPSSLTWFSRNCWNYEVVQ